MPRRLHPCKATCAHGRPWYEVCQHCDPDWPEDQRVSMHVEIGTNGQKWYTLTYSNFYEWARNNPDLAEALTQ